MSSRLMPRSMATEDRNSGPKCATPAAIDDRDFQVQSSIREINRRTPGERWLLHTRGAWEIAGASTFGRGAWEVPGASESAKWAACGFPGGPTPARAACDAPGAPIFELLGAWSVPGAPAAGSAARHARVAAGRPNSERRLRWARRADEEKGRLEAPGRPEGVWAAWKLAGAPNSTGNMAPAMFPVVTAALLIAAAASSLVPAALPAGGAGGARPPSAGPSGAPEAGSDTPSALVLYS